MDLGEHGPQRCPCFAGQSNTKASQVSREAFCILQSFASLRHSCQPRLSHDFVPVWTWVYTVPSDVLIPPNEATQKPPRFSGRLFAFCKASRLYDTVESHVSAMILCPFGLRCTRSPAVSLFRRTKQHKSLPGFPGGYSHFAKLRAFTTRLPATSQP